MCAFCHPKSDSRLTYVSSLASSSCSSVKYNSNYVLIGDSQFHRLCTMHEIRKVQLSHVFEKRLRYVNVKGYKCIYKFITTLVNNVPVYFFTYKVLKLTRQYEKARMKESEHVFKACENGINILKVLITVLVYRSFIINISQDIIALSYIQYTCTDKEFIQSKQSERILYTYFILFSPICKFV